MYVFILIYMDGLLLDMYIVLYSERDAIVKTQTEWLNVVTHFFLFSIIKKKKKHIEKHIEIIYLRRLIKQCCSSVLVATLFV